MKSITVSVYFGYHDSCVTFANESEILLHLEAERVFRKKHMRVSSRTMKTLINLGLSALGLHPNSIKDVLVASWNNQFEEYPLQLFGYSFETESTSHHANHIGTIAPGATPKTLVVCSDGGSEDGSGKLYLLHDGKIQVLEDLEELGLTGKFYGTITQMIVCPRFIEAHAHFPGHTMALAGLGSYSDEYWNLLNEYRKELNSLHPKGSKALRELFGLSENFSNIWDDERRVNLAFTAQLFWEQELLSIICKHKHLADSICLVGGCALNVKLNTLVVEKGWFQNVYVPPVAGDSGQSLGAILSKSSSIECCYPFLGRGFGDTLLSQALVDALVSDLCQHKIIGWYSGRSESGPRALGHRSLLGLPDSMLMKSKLSEIVKQRPPYVPVAASVAEEYVCNFTATRTHLHSPYMSFAPRVRPEIHQDLPAIVHADGTCRFQTVSESDNPILYALLDRVGETTGYPILMNSSFNIRGEPIVDTPADALNCFRKSCIDVLYINGQRFVK